jgi:hypothetical protein
MTGAKNLVGSDRSLAMRLSAVNYDGYRINKVIITLDPTDTYTLVAGYVRNSKFTQRFERSEIYAEDIQDVFTRATGLYTSLRHS